MNDGIRITGRVNGADKVAYMLGMAPRVMTSAVRQWLYGERTRFVGKRAAGKIGKFGTKLSRKNLKGRPGTWSRQAAAAFRGYISGGGQLAGMSLRMGTPRKHPSDFVQGVADMAHGGGSFSSSKFMPIPFWRGLQWMGVTKRAYAYFREMSAAGRLFATRRGGKVMWFTKGTAEEEPELVFVGSKRVSPGPLNLGFEQMWAGEIPRAVRRAENKIDRTIRGLERGYIKVQ